jgi:hypothetical protein
MTSNGGGSGDLLPQSADNIERLERWRKDAENVKVDSAEAMIAKDLLRVSTRCGRRWREVAPQF